ncbi:MAG: hypothetical protein Kow00107_02630 [Planctomycetota bacterium]
MALSLDTIENGDKLKRLLELLPVLEELVEKYERTRQQIQQRPVKKPSESRFIRSFRKS